MVPTDITLDDFDALMDVAAGKKPRPKSTLTPYGPVNPNLAPVELNFPPLIPPRPVAIPPSPLVMSMPVPQAFYINDPEPRHSAFIHVALAFFTGGIGNIFYGAYMADRRRAWRRRHNI